MWIFLNDSFLSVVQDNRDPSRLLVRSRIPGDIERAVCGLFQVDVFEHPSADYRYRCFMTREDFERAMVQAVRRIDYDNFKNSIPNPRRKQAAKRVWQVLHRCFGGYGVRGELEVKAPPMPPDTDDLEVMERQALEFNGYHEFGGGGTDAMPDLCSLGKREEGGWHGRLRHLRGQLFIMQRALRMQSQSPGSNEEEVREFKRLYRAIRERWAEAEESRIDHIENK